MSDVRQSRNTTYLEQAHCVAAMTALQDLAPHWPQINALLDEALALPASDRPAWLARLGGERAALRDTVARLLAVQAEVDTGDFLGTLPKLVLPLTDASGAALNEAAAGELIGPYRLLSPLGQGGMGAVWLAERSDGQLKRQVALKLPRLTWGSAVAERLARERDILATLSHPHIARLYDAGVDGHGRPYLAMEYVQGLPIDVYCDQKTLPLPQRVQLLLQVAGAVAHAHARLVVHRDLKPANILVTEEGQVRLLDFGIAKLLEGEHTQETALTRVAGAAMTLDYASPEQIRGDPLTTASDVYSLAVVAYELLAGARPYRLQRGSAAELEEAIASAEPKRASEAARDVAVRNALRGDLDAILNKALKKRAEERYAGVEALAEDLRRHLRHEAVLAQPDRLAYRAGKFLQRHRLPVAAGVVTAAALVAGTTVAWVQALRAEAERQLAVAANQRALASQAAAEIEAAAAREQRGAALAAQQRAERAAESERVAAAEATRQAERALQASRDAERAGRQAAAAATREREQAGLAQTEAERARAVSTYLVGLFSAANPGQANAQQMQAMTAVQLLDRGVARVDELAAASPAARLQLLSEFANANAGLGRYAQSLALRQRAVAEAESLHGVGSLPALTHRVYLARTLALVGRRDDAVREIDTALSGLAKSHPQSSEYAEALIGSASLFQPIDPVRSLRDAEQSVRLHETLATQAAATGRRLGRGVEDRHRDALFQLGLQQQTGGALRQSLATLDSAAERLAAALGATNRYTVNVRTRRLYSLLALGRYAEVVREAPALIEANAGFDAASAMLVPQVRLYHARALSALGRHAEAEQQTEAAIEERAREPNPAISPRLDTFRGLLWVVRLEAQPQADAVRALQAMLEANEGVAATRMLWATTLVKACLALNDRPCAERQAARAAGLANGSAATPEMKLEQLLAAAQLVDTTTPAPQLQTLLAALLPAEAAAESDHHRARVAWARATALHHAGHSAEAAAALRERAAAAAGQPLQHAGLRAQIDALTATLQGAQARVNGKAEVTAPR